MSGHSDDTPLVCVTRVEDAVWDRFKAQVETENADGFRAYVRFLTGPQYLGLGPDELRAAFPSTDHLVILAADEMTFQHPATPVLCIDPEGRSAAFRVALAHLWIVENNLAIANMLFEEMAEDQVVDGWLDVSAD